ncbi:MAG: heavy metal-binding domain-containing protein [Planctomycetota bacterium]
MKTLLTASLVAAGLLLGGCGKSEDDHSGHKHGPGEEHSWTCPMHPEVKSDKPGKCPKCGMDLTVAKEEKGHEGHGHGGEPVKVSSKGFDDSVAQMETRLKTIDALIASGKLDEVHKEAEVICNLAKGMPEQTKGWPADKAASAAENAAKLAGMFREIDSASDGGKPDETRTATAKMRELVGKLKTLSPGTKHDHEEGSHK